MKFKSVIPYLLLGSALIWDPSQGTARNDKGDRPEFDTITTIYANPIYATYQLYDFGPSQEQIKQHNLEQKAENLRDAYVENMLDAQQKLGPLVGKRGYYSAVRRELPGAPVGQHCVYGQYTQLNRALQEKGDTLTIIPQEAKAACIQFKQQMRKQYDTPEFQGAIYEGVMFETQAAYDDALTRYLVRNGVKDDTPDSVRMAKTQQFAKTNYCADSLNPGSILIVPRYHGARNKFHAIMYLGRGEVIDGKFTENKNGRHIYTAHNRERIGDLFKTWDTRNVFAADTKKIVQTRYAQELARIEAMPTEELIHFLMDDKTQTQDTLGLRLTPREELVQMARNKYFDLPQDKKTFNLHNAYAHAIRQKKAQVDMAKRTMLKRAYQRTI